MTWLLPLTTFRSVNPNVKWPFLLKEIAVEWNNLSDDVKREYGEKAAEKLQQFKQEMAEYNGLMKRKVCLAPVASRYAHHLSKTSDDRL